jgi:hypothetical protein
MPDIFGDIAAADVIVAVITGLLLVVFVGGLFVACREAAQHLPVKWPVRWHRK